MPYSMLSSNWHFYSLYGARIEQDRSILVHVQLHAKVSTVTMGCLSQSTNRCCPFHSLNEFSQSKLNVRDYVLRHSSQWSCICKKVENVESSLREIILFMKFDLLTGLSSALICTEHIACEFARTVCVCMCVRVV